jgi:hemerythrin
MQLQSTIEFDSIQTPAKVDRQRERITASIDRLEIAIEKQAESGEFCAALEELTRQTRASFKDQEATWTQRSDRERGWQRGWHSDAHRFMLEYLERLRQEREQTDDIILRIRLCFIRQWLMKHFRSEDFDPD